MTKTRQNITVEMKAYYAALHELPQGKMSETYELGMKLMLLLLGSEVYTIENTLPELITTIGKERLQNTLADMGVWVEQYG